MKLLALPSRQVYCLDAGRTVCYHDTPLTTAARVNEADMARCIVHHDSGVPRIPHVEVPDV